MIGHQAMTVMMADMCLQHAVHPELLFATFTGRANQATNGRTALPVVLGGLLLAGRLLGTFSTVRLALFGPGPLKLRPR